MKYILLITVTFCGLILSCNKKENCNKWDAWPERDIYVVLMKDGVILPDSITSDYFVFVVWKGDTLTDPGMIRRIEGKGGDFDDSLFLNNYNSHYGVIDTTTSSLYFLRYLQYNYIDFGVSKFYLKNKATGSIQEIEITAEEVSNCQAKEIEDCQCRIPLRSISVDGIPLVADQELAEHYGIQWPLYKLYKIEAD